MTTLSLLIVSAALSATIQLSALPIKGDHSVYLPFVRQGGTSITVNTVDDELNEDGDCSLREAIQAANLDRTVDACPAGSGNDLVRVPAGEYNLTRHGSNEDGNTSGDLDVLSELTIVGADRDQTILGGEYSDRVFEIHQGAAATIERVTIQNGIGPLVGTYDPFGGCGGGGVLNAGQLVLRQAAVRWNTTTDGVPSDQFYCGNAQDGGGICNQAGGRLQVVETLIYENSTGNGGSSCFRRQGSGGSGAGILNGGEASIVLSEIFDNVAGRGFAGGSGGSGGGILNNGVMDVISTTVHDNRSGSGVSAHIVGLYGGGGVGAGIASRGDGRLTIVASRVYSNVTGVDNEASDGGEGGGIYSTSAMTMTNSTVSGNQASENGGGGISAGAETVIAGSTIASNTAATSGGGIYSSGAMTMTNSTVSGNRASENGGGGVYTVSEMVIASSTIASNTAATTGGGAFMDVAYLSSGNLKLRNVLVAGNVAGVAGPDCYGTLSSFGYNLLGSDAGCTIGGDAVGNLYNQPAQLLPLGDWGGSTWTHDLTTTSPALDAGICTDLAGQPLTSDQRGIARPQGASCDIGAVEHQTSESFTHLGVHE